MNLKRWLGGLANGARSGLDRVAPEVTVPEDSPPRQSRSMQMDSAAALSSNSSSEAEQAAYRQPRNRRAERIRSWRRRALSKKGGAVVLGVGSELGGKGDRGFRKAAAACAAVEVPTNGYLDLQGSDWSCERGFRKGDRQCEALTVPANAHLSYSGDNWRCDSGFLRQGALCVAD